VTVNHPAQGSSAATAPQRTYAVLLAAGGGSRFIGSLHKLQVVLRGRPVYRWALDALHEAVHEPVHNAGGLIGAIVITGAVELELPDWVVHAHNPDWSSGQASSLHVGLSVARQLGADAIVVGLADQPFVRDTAWIAVARANTPIAVATYGGVRGHPVRLHHSVWSSLATEGDQGARSLMIQRPELVGEVACEGSAADIDTMEDLQRWNSSTNS
jgi:CTP:molybdopterin cytidylyltransferase MocA